jgi:hypothetical protein
MGSCRTTCDPTRRKSCVARILDLAEELLKTKASIPVSNWLAQYMQNPTAEEGAILKRDWWRDWTNKYPPPLDYIIQIL